MDVVILVMVGLEEGEEENGVFGVLLEQEEGTQEEEGAEEVFLAAAVHTTRAHPKTMNPA